MARLNIKLVVVCSVCTILLITLFFLAPSSKITSANSNNQISLNDSDYHKTLRVRPGAYTVYIKTPFHTETQNIKIGIFNTKKLTVDESKVEAGIDQVTQKYMERAGYNSVDINSCTIIENLHYVCETYQLSSIRPVEMTFQDGDWSMNLDINKVSNPAARAKFDAINAGVSQR